MQKCESEANLNNAALVATTLASSSVVFLTSACLLVLYFKQGLFKRWRDGKVEKEESNNVYGLYYTEDGQQIDQGTVEVVDVNHYYG